MLDPGLGNTSEASNSETRITDTTQDSNPGMRPSCMAKPSSDEPYAVMSARTGLWEAWVSNHPGPPGHLYLATCSFYTRTVRPVRATQSVKLARVFAPMRATATTGAGITGRQSDDTASVNLRAL